MRPSALLASLLSLAAAPLIGAGEVPSQKDKFRVMSGGKGVGKE
jgi:hypothetical protein